MHIEDKSGKSHQKFFNRYGKTLRAYHEAGHAVMCYLLKKKFSYVTIRKDNKNNSSGHLQYNRLKCIHKGQRNYRQYIIRKICIYFAGLQAELLILRCQEWSPDIIDDLVKIAVRTHCITNDENSDSKNITQLSLDYVNNDVDLALKIQDKCQIKAGNLLSNNWAAVEALVTALLSKNSKIKYMEARKIIKDALGKHD